MVKISFKIINNKIQKVEMAGHANAGSYGNDLVCAAVTGIISGAMNAFDINHKEDVDMKVLDNKIIVQILNLENTELQIILSMLQIQLDTIAIQYPKNVELKEVR